MALSRLDPETVLCHYESRKVKKGLKSWKWVLPNCWQFGIRGVRNKVEDYEVEEGRESSYLSPTHVSQWEKGERKELRLRCLLVKRIICASRRIGEREKMSIDHRRH